MKKIKTGSDFSGVGAFDQALERLGITQEKKFACDMDKYARQTYILNFGEPEYYPTDVYEREIPEESLDIYMTSPPCQTFSLAGNRKGEKDKRGILFYNSHEFIKINQPRFFIFENVKGLLSDDKSNKKQKYGKTFTTWLQYLGGKSINGVPTLFPHEEAVNYHIYHKVLNAKHYGIPQNRERVFIVGIRDDKDNVFSWPKTKELKKRLIDVLEHNVDDKYYLSDTMIKGFVEHKNRHDSKNNGFGFEISNVYKEAKSITTKPGYRNTCNFIKDGFINQDTQVSSVINENSISQTLCSGSHGYANGYVKIGAIRGRNPENPKQRIAGQETQQMLEINENGTSNALTTVQKDNVVIQLNKSKESGNAQPYKQNRVYDTNGISPVLDTECGRPGYKTYLSIRRLTPLECFRLMDFNENFIEKTINSKLNLYFRIFYNNFDTNKKETQWNAKLKIVKEPLIQKNTETYVLCTTKECQKLEQLTSVQKDKLENLLNVNIVIEKLEELEQKECVINITKWTDCTETHFISKIKGVNQVVVGISETHKGNQFTEQLWKINLGENLTEKKLFITLILLKQIMMSKIYTYAKIPVNTPKYINSIINYEKDSERLLLSFLKMEFTKQVVSDTRLYKQAGNSICVGVLAAIISKLKL